MRSLERLKQLVFTEIKCYKVILVKTTKYITCDSGCSYRAAGVKLKAKDKVKM